jgi:SAM-dependent methyltransferase
VKELKMKGIIFIRILHPGNEKAIQLLLQKGADLNITDPSGRNALLVSVGSHQKGYIELLVSYGIDINSQDSDGNTALHYPLINVLENRQYLPYSKEFVKILMDAGADPEIRNREGKSPIDLAAESGKNESIDLLKSSEKRLARQQSIESWEKRTFIKQPPEKVMDAAGIKPGMIIGEVGAGRGRFTMHLARCVGKNGKILANDIDAEALAYLRERCKRARINNVETILGEVDDPHFQDGALDMVFMVWTYHYFDQPMAMLKKLLPTLKPGGTMVLVEPDPIRGPGGEDHGISPERLRQDAAQAGLEVVRIDDFLPEDLIFVLKIRD